MKTESGTESERPDEEADSTEVSDADGSASDSSSRGKLSASLQFSRSGFRARFAASLTTDDNELSHRFWGAVIRHLRCWLAVAVAAVLVVTLASGLISGRLFEFIDALLR